MDSLSQIALGSSVALAAMGRRTRAWPVVAWGAAMGTLPDLDTFIPYGDPVLDMVLHRADSHALLYLTLLAPVLGTVIAWATGGMALWRRWVWVTWLALFTHPLLDWMTVYGTQLWRPFTDHPYGVGSVFIIDPAYTLPLLVGLVWAWARHGQMRAPSRAHVGVYAGLLVSTLYLGWSAAAQHHVRGVAVSSLAAQGLSHEQVLVTPTAFNTVLWRVVSMGPDTFYEGYHSLLDEPPAPGQPTMRFTPHDRGATLEQRWGTHPAVERIKAFSQGFYKLQERQGRVRLIDLRMGQEPAYVFTFDLGAVGSEHNKPHGPVVQQSERGDVGRSLRWLWQRLLGQPLPPPG
jgi:inner membrane protein